MSNERARRSAGLLAAIAATLATLPVAASTAQAAEGCAVGVGSFQIDAVLTSSNASRITLWYDPNAQCAWANIEGVPNYAQVWLDRREPYQGMVGGVRVTNSSGYGGTDTWSMRNKSYRACGSNGSGQPISCTNWH